MHKRAHACNSQQLLTSLSLSLSLSLHQMSQHHQKTQCQPRWDMQLITLPQANTCSSASWPAIISLAKSFILRSLCSRSSSWHHRSDCMAWEQARVGFSRPGASKLLKLQKDGSEAAFTDVEMGMLVTQRHVLTTRPPHACCCLPSCNYCKMRRDCWCCWPP